MNFRETIGFGKENASSVVATDKSLMAYVKGTLEAVRGIGTAGGAAVNKDCMDDNDGGALTPTSGAAAYDTQTGTWANTSALDGTLHTLIKANNPGIAYEFRCGGGTSPVALVWTGYVGTSDARAASIAAWNYDTGAWEVIGSITGQNTTTNIVKNIVLYSRHIGDGSSASKPLGKVFIRLLGTTANSTSINTDQIYVTYAVTSRSAGYADGAIWIDTVNGVAGTEPFVNGTADNPCLTYADAETLENSLGIVKFKIIAGSTIAIDGAVITDIDKHVFEGHNWTMTFTNNVSVVNAYISGATVSGATVGKGCDLNDCNIGSLTIDSADFYSCIFTGNLTTIASGTYNFYQCVDGIPGTTNPHIILTANTTLGIRGWMGGIEFESIAATNTIAIDGAGRIVLHSNCSGGTLIIRGAFSLTDEVASPGWVAGGGVLDNSTDSLEAISDKMGAFSGDGGAAQDDSAKASLDLVHSEVAAIQADIGDPSARANLKTIEAMLGNPDSVGKTIYDNIGDFVGRTNLKSLLAVLGIPDVAGQSIYAMQGAFTTAENLKAILGDLATTKRLGQILGSLDETNTLKAILGAYTAASPLKTAIDSVLTLVDSKVAGKIQMAVKTLDLNQAASSYDLFTGTTQAVILEKLSVKMPTGAAGGALTSISIQTNDATPGVIISSALGAVANLTSKAELSWTGCMVIPVGTKIQLTIAGGAHGSAYVASIVAECRAVVSSGYLA